MLKQIPKTFYFRINNRFYSNKLIRLCFASRVTIRYIFMVFTKINVIFIYVPLIFYLNYKFNGLLHHVDVFKNFNMINGINIK